MKHGIKVPAVGESITEVTVAQWLKKDGEQVNADDLICEIESDKASFEIPAEQSGVLKILANEGDVVAVGSNLAEIHANGAGEGAAKTEAPAEAAPELEEAPAPVEEAPAATETAAPAGDAGAFQVVIPTVGESITEVTLAQWLKKDGESVALDELICEIESDKASFEIPAEQSGTLKTLVAEGDTLEIGAVIAEIHGNGQSGAAPAAEPKAESAAPAAEAPSKKAKVTPVAANILKEAGIDAGTVNGSGSGGMITKDDALKAVKSAPANAPEAKKAPAPAAKETPAEAPAPGTAAPAGERLTRRERMSTLRKTIAKRLVSAKNETAMLTTFNEVDMTAIKNLRAQYKASFKEKYEVNLGFMSFFTKACCIALQEWPAVNAQIDGDHIIYNDFCDISIAVSTPRGLVVPVIRNADSLTPAGIEKEVLRLALKARDNKLTIDEMTGGTFTITNGGVFGSLMSTPIINAPQSAILGMHKIQDRPMVVNGEVVVLPMMYLALSYDHRIVDGRESVSFLVRLKELLEDPSRMLLEI